MSPSSQVNRQELVIKAFLMEAEQNTCGASGYWNSMELNCHRNKFLLKKVSRHEEEDEVLRLISHCLNIYMENLYMFFSFSYLFNVVAGFFCCFATNNAGLKRKFLCYSFLIYYSFQIEAKFATRTC